MKKLPFNIELCPLNEWENLEAFLKNAYGLSGQKIKAYLGVKERTKKVKLRVVLNLPINLINNKMISPRYTGELPQVIYEDKIFQVLHKPFNIHSHPLEYSDSDNLLNWMMAQREYEALKVNQQNYDRGLLYRLDYATSGLMIYIKTQSDYSFLREHFSDIVKEKFYLAVLSADVKEEQSFFHNLRFNKNKVYVSKEKTLNEAKIDVYPVMRIANKSLVLIRLYQGHRHQIRVQLSSSGLPILGDELYGGEKAQRTYLHCFQYSLKLKGRNYQFQDDNFSLLETFFDPNRAFEMIHNKLLRIK